MDETLSALIAFTGFLIVFSMLIQSVQEALKNVFKLKTGVWERFFINLYHTDFKKKSDLKGKRFWQRFRRGRFIGEFEHRLLRLKKIIIKLDDLLKDIKKTLLEIQQMPDSQISKKMGNLYEKMSLIRAMKMETILKLYEKNLLVLEAASKEEDSSTPENQASETDQLNSPASATPDPESLKLGPISAFSSEFKQIYSQLSSWPKLTPDQVKTTCNHLLNKITDIESTISTYRHQIEHKADSWLVQLQGEYKKYMLEWTIVISFFAVVILNADTFAIYRHFNMNTSAQKIIVESVESSIQEVTKMRTKDLNIIYEFLQKDELGKAKTKMAELTGQFVKSFTLLNDAKNKENAQSILATLQKMDASDPSHAAAIKHEFDTLADLFIKYQKKTIDHHVANLDIAGLPLWWHTDLKAFQAAHGLDAFVFFLKKVLGLLLSVFLVSFGAPFWKNIMNALIGIKNISARPDSGRRNGQQLLQ